VFALVLALKLVPAIKPHYLTDIRSVASHIGRRQIHAVGFRLCAKAVPFRGTKVRTRALHSVDFGRAYSEHTIVFDLHHTIGQIP